MISLIRHIALSFVALVLIVSSSNANELFAEGVEAFESNKLAIASEKFNAVIEQNPNDVSAYYNLGLAEKGQDNFGKAIWAFEKALKLKPNDSEAISQIEECYTELGTNEAYQPIVGGFLAGVYSISSDIWAVLSIAFSVLFCISVILLKRLQSISVKRLLLMSSFFSVIALIACVLASSGSKDYAEQTDYAIVTQISIPTYTEEGNASKTALTEGIRLQLIDLDSTEFIRVRPYPNEEHIVKFEDVEFI